MSIEIKIPSPGESITEVVIEAWLKADGDYVELDEVLCEIETDKATLPFPAEVAGTLKILIPEGEEAKVGDVLCTIDPAGATAKSPAPSEAIPAEASMETPAPAPTDPQVTATGKITEIKIPSPGESITEVVIETWMKADGDYVELDEVLCEIETDKATLPFPSEVAGILKIVIPEGSEAKVGDVLCTIAATDAPATKPAETTVTETSQPASPAAASYTAGVPSVAAAKIIAEKDLKAEEIQGTGKGGRITKADALEAQKAPTPPQPTTPQATPKPAVTPPAAKAPAPPTPQAPSQPAPAGTRNVRHEKMTRIRKKISERLVAVKNETAMLTTFNEVDMHAVMELRSKYKDGFLKKHNVKLGFMSFFTKACTEALRDFPAVNGMIAQEEIVFHDYVDMGIAVSAPRGLVVPVIRNAESMSLAQIEAEIVRLATKARDNKLSIDEMSGGTFSITNGGIFGSMLSTPIINPPQSAILGMHNIVQRPLAVNGKVEIRPVMYLALSYDHRIIDGRESVSFLVKVKEYLEDPARLLLGV